MMDAVEFPLPADVAVSKFLGSDGFGRLEESAIGADSSGFGGNKASGCGSYHKEIKCAATTPEPSLVSRNKGSDVKFCVNDKHLSFGSENNGHKRPRFGEADRTDSLFLKNENKQLNRKSVKNHSILPCSKRPRTDQTEFLLKTTVSEACDDASRKMEIEIINCSSAERSRMVKQKRCADNKRNEKKSFRAGGKSKYEASVPSSDSTAGANHILGIYGLKSDLHDITELVDEVSLSELLDGNYNYSKLHPDKGKRTGNSNENTLVSVRKACTVLTSHGNGNRKGPTNMLNLNDCLGKMSDFNGINKCTEESESSKAEDPDRPDVKNSILYHPKEILDRLALPPAYSLDSLILDLNMSPFSLQSATPMTALRSSSLPPFPWSFPHNGACKSNVENCKLLSTRVTCQGRWVRIGSSSAECSFSAESEVKKCNCNNGSLDQKKMEDLLQYVNALSLSVKPSERPFYTSHQTYEVNDLNTNTTVEATGVFGSCSHTKHDLMPGQAGFSRVQLNDGNFICQEKQGNYEDPLTNNLKCMASLVNHKDHHTSSSNRWSESCYPWKGAGVGCSQGSWTSPTLETFKSGYSPRVLAAAETLWEMASSSNCIRTGNHIDGSLKWPKTTSQKAMKAHKSLFSLGKTEEPILAGGHHDPSKATCIASSKHKWVSEKNSTHTNIISRSPVISSASSEGLSPVKLERDLAIYPKPLLGNPVRSSALSIRSPLRFERDCSSQHKMRSFGGTAVRDWSKGRSKRL